MKKVNIIVNKNIPIKVFVIITIFTVLMGVLLIYFGTKGFINVNILKSYKREVAEINYSMIININHMDSENDSYKRKIKYVYFVDDKQYEGEEILWWRFIFKSDKNVKVGDKISIFYNVNNPSQSEVYHISYMLIIVGLCFIVVSLLLLRQRIKEK